MAWIKQWGQTIADKPSRPGVWRLKDGGCLIRGRATDPRTGHQRDIRLVLPSASVQGAAEKLLQEQQRVRAGGLAPRHRQRFGEYATSWLKGKIASRDIRSAAGRRSTGAMLACHILPAFGECFVDQIRMADLKTWRTQLGEKINAREISPHSANNRIMVLRCCLRDAIEELELENDPTRILRKFSCEEHPTYTEEEPGSLTPEEVPAFLSAMMSLCPDHFAMVALGFATGLRCSSLRPLRRKGAQADLRLDKRVLYVRRSHTEGMETMDRTKQGTRYPIALPDDLCSLLRWHCERLDAAGDEGELLFPGMGPDEDDRFLSSQSLRRPFIRVRKALKMKKRFTPSGMRRTYQDLMRRAAVADIVTRSISGHATEVMQEHYSTVGAEEQRQAIGKVIKLAGLPRLLKRAA